VLRRHHARYVTEGIVLASLVKVAYMVLKSKSRWQVVQELALIADMASFLHKTGLARSLGEQSRHHVASTSLKVATTIKWHGTLLAMPGAPRERIAKSLVNAASSVHKERWADLAQIDPDTSLKSTFRRYIPRVLTASLLVAAAITVPMITSLVPVAQGGYVRATLLIAAFFSLLASDTGKIRDVTLGLAKDTMGPKGKD
jgi:hypothetical protein